jgi:peptidoglycan-associated lipoprotein
MKKVLLGALMSSLLAACASSEVKEQPKAVVENKAPAAAQKAAEARPATEKGTEANPLRDPNNILSKRSVYFDFDKSNIKDEYTPLIKAHASYLAGHKDAGITIQGNCDERGSREYNIALGHRRAESVKKMMEVLGAAGKQIETVSFGKEKPRATCHEESCWKENRRADIVYRGE